MTTPVVSPGHDLALTIDYEELDPATARLGPMVTGPVTARLVGMPVGEAPSADGTSPVDVLAVGASHVGNGRWLAQFEGDDLDAGVLEPVYGNDASPLLVPWIIFEVAGGGPFVVRCRYELSRIIAAR